MLRGTKYQAQVQKKQIIRKRGYKFKCIDSKLISGKLSQFLVQGQNWSAVEVRCVVEDPPNDKTCSNYCSL